MESFKGFEHLIGTVVCLTATDKNRVKYGHRDLIGTLDLIDVQMVKIDRVGIPRDSKAKDAIPYQYAVIQDGSSINSRSARYACDVAEFRPATSAEIAQHAKAMEAMEERRARADARRSTRNVVFRSDDAERQALGRLKTRASA